MDLVSPSSSWSSERVLQLSKPVTWTSYAKSSVAHSIQGSSPSLSSDRVMENTTLAPMSYTFPLKSELCSYSEHAQGLPGSIFGVHMDNQQGIVVWGLDRLQQSPWNTLYAMFQQRANIPICYHITRKRPSVPEGDSLPMLSHTDAAACFRICWLWAHPRVELPLFAWCQRPNQFCSCRSANGERAIFLLPEVTSTQHSQSCEPPAGRVQLIFLLCI